MSRYPILLIIAYVIDRLYWYFAGVRFDAYGIGGMGEPTHLMQLYPMELMRSPLWMETIWYNHSQPPLYSLFLRIVGFQPTVVHIVWMALGIATVLALYSIISELLCGGAQ